MLTELTTDVAYHQKQDLLPNDVGGLTGPAFQALCDQGVTDVKVYINDVLLAELASALAGTSAAENLGSAPIIGIVGDTIYAQIANLLAVAQAAQAGSILPGSITDLMLANNPAYQLAGGTGTAITLTLPTLTDLFSKTFIASANNSGATTTINSLPFLKENTIIPPTLIAGKAYTAWFSTSGNCFFVKASAEGTATTAQVLAGVPFSNENYTGLIGTMPDLGANGLTPATTAVTITAGYRNGSGEVAAVTSAIDANIIAANILSGINILGVAGTAINGAGMKKYATGSGPSGSGHIIVSGLTFTPSVIEINQSGNVTYYDVSISSTLAYMLNYAATYPASVYYGGFDINKGYGAAFTYKAWE